MAELMIRPGLLCGRIEPPPSKSDAHRGLIAAGLAGDIRLVHGLTDPVSEDIQATRRCLQGLAEKNRVLDCGESGTTLRLLLPVAAALGAGERTPLTFTGAGRLPQRPLDEYRTILGSHGVALDFQAAGLPRQKSFLPLQLHGRLHGGTFPVPGHISSQYISGLLFALPLLQEDSLIRLTSPLESAPYVAMTLRTLRSFGVIIDEIPGGYRVPGKQKYSLTPYWIEKDYSQAAFWLTAAYGGSPLTVIGLAEDSVQGDKAVIGLLAGMTARKTGRAAARDEYLIDAADIPDLVPILAVAAAMTPGTTRIVKAARLRLKESDRLQATCLALGSIGANIRETRDGLLIRGCPETSGSNPAGCLEGGTASSFADHRIAMALAVAALYTREGVRLQGAEAVNKSYPEFFREFRRLGGDLDELNMGTNIKNQLVW